MLGLASELLGEVHCFWSTHGPDPQVGGFYATLDRCVPGSGFKSCCCYTCLRVGPCFRTPRPIYAVPHITHGHYSLRSNASKNAQVCDL